MKITPEEFLAAYEFIQQRVIHLTKLQGEWGRVDYEELRFHERGVGVPCWDHAHRFDPDYVTQVWLHWDDILTLADEEYVAGYTQRKKDGADFARRDQEMQAERERKIVSDREKAELKRLKSLYPDG